MEIQKRSQKDSTDDERSLKITNSGFRPPTFSFFCALNWLRRMISWDFRLKLLDNSYAVRNWGNYFLLLANISLYAAVFFTFRANEKSFAENLLVTISQLTNDSHFNGFIELRHPSEMPRHICHSMSPNSIPRRSKLLTLYFRSSSEDKPTKSTTTTHKHRKTSETKSK